VNNKSKNDDSCQLQVVYESGGPLSLSDKLRNTLLRMKSAVNRRFPNCHSRSATDEGAVPGNSSERYIPEANGSPATSYRGYKPGDLVEVLSMDEIRSTLDSDNKSGGLAFMPGMERFAGKRFAVLKGVRTIFDERAWKMVKVKDTVILREVFCDGRDMFDKEGCDRCCFFFWKERWLRKVDSR